LTVLGRFVDANIVRICQGNVVEQAQFPIGSAARRLMEDLVDGNFALERAYSAHDRLLPVEAPSFDQSAFEPALRMKAGASFIVMLLCSLGLWAAIWAVVASLILPWL
jgi:hypothetical protein